MKRLSIFLFFFLIAFMTIAQTQKGIVKTRGRMVNGKHVPGGPSWYNNIHKGQN